MLCAQPAGAITEPIDRHGIICADCASAVRQWADGVAGPGLSGDLPTGVEEYATAHREERRLTVTAGAELVPDTSAAGLGGSPAGSGRRRY